jgi:hypothetical protein
MGRQTSLFQIEWEGDRPWGMAPTTAPVQKPNLPKSGILWRSVKSDYFDADSLNLAWHFLSKKAASQYSLSARRGWIRLSPDTARAHVLQKETDHMYSAVTLVEFNPTDTAKAGLYLTNGNQRVNVQLYSGYNNGKKIIFKNDTAVRGIDNPFGNNVWLKIERNGHELTGYCSGDGDKWIPVGAAISAVNMDKVQPNYNSWVGTSVGLFAEGKPADFDFFVCKDGFSLLPAAGYSNYFGVQKVKQDNRQVVTNTSAKGGWLMISGVQLGRNKRTASQVEVTASSKTGGKIEIWVDDLATGKLVATIPVAATGSENNFRAFSKAMKKLAGHHDVFLKFPAGNPQNIYIESIRFSGGK